MLCYAMLLCQVTQLHVKLTMVEALASSEKRPSGHKDSACVAEFDRL